MRNDRGSALILAVIAMLVMGVLSLSFALLADIETKIGVNYKQQAQAEALAEAALERARDFVRTAPSAVGGFTGWINGTAAGMSGAHLYNWNNTTLGAGWYSARIDNDCALANTVPASIEEKPVGGVPCNNTADTNETAVLTAWAQTTNGVGSSRIRAVVAVDNPWKHVCSNAKPDNNGYCNEPGNRNGSPTINPSDPNDPNGPAAYNALPYPVLGCSKIAPGLHRGPHLLAVQLAGCAANNGMYSHPTPGYPTAPGAPPRMVIMGEIPGVTTAAKTCPAPNTAYYGYFDCALTTWCDPVTANDCGPNSGPGGIRKACVPAADLRWSTDAAHYVQYDPLTGQCGTGQAWETGMVFGVQGAGWGGTVNFGQTMGSPNLQFDVYVFDQAWSQGNNRQFYGTLVVEGNGGGGIQFAVGNGAATQLWAGKNGLPATAGWPAPMTYGYPLVSLTYDPDLAPPTVVPTYAPQNFFADFGSSNTDIHGIIYSGGHVNFNPLSFDGGVIAFEIQTQGSATYTYNTTYGNSTPPPGFLAGTGNQVVIIRKSFIVCVGYAADTGANPTGCN